MPDPLRLSCPSRYHLDFDNEQHSFFKPVTPCAYFGREKGVCDKLQRHPLINPIFEPQPSPERRGKVLSAPFARGNLHLVIPQNGTQPLILRYSIVNLYYSRRFYTSESAFVKSEIKAFIHHW